MAVDIPAWFSEQHPRVQRELMENRHLKLQQGMISRLRQAGFAVNLTNSTRMPDELIEFLDAQAASDESGS